MITWQGPARVVGPGLNQFLPWTERFNPGITAFRALNPGLNAVQMIQRAQTGMAGIRNAPFRNMRSWSESFLYVNKGSNIGDGFVNTNILGEPTRLFRGWSEKPQFGAGYTHHATSWQDFFNEAGDRGTGDFDPGRDSKANFRFKFMMKGSDRRINTGAAEALEEIMEEAVIYAKENHDKIGFGSKGGGFGQGKGWKNISGDAEASIKIYRKGLTKTGKSVVGEWGFGVYYGLFLELKYGTLRYSQGKFFTPQAMTNGLRDALKKNGFFIDSKKPFNMGASYRPDKVKADPWIRKP